MKLLRYPLLVMTLILLSTQVSSGEIKRFHVPLEDTPSCGPEDAAITIVEFLDYQ